MESRAVPQDEISTHTNTRKAIYATDCNGAYGIVPSSGWEVEAEVTLQAVDELVRLASEAYDKVVTGVASPLYFYMFARRMDLDILAQASGIGKWWLKRHMRPDVFAKLPHKTVARYADALGMEVEALYQLPEKRPERA
ncbi:MAG: hypothetical protein J7J71_02580 [Deltaproteobacteria bacterium]|nr:hypothetical protein [Candidatus Tharpella sp.]